MPTGPHAIRLTVQATGDYHAFAMEQGNAQSAGRVVLAGIDEAGFGPTLGPMVVGASAWEVPAGVDGGDLWQLLRGGLTRRPSRRYARIAIDDSKNIFNRSRGLVELERGVLGTFAVSAGEMPERLGDFLARVAPDGVEGLESHRWYTGWRERALPVEADSADVRVRSAGLRTALARNDVRFLGAGLEIVCEERYNRLYDAIGNKGSMLFSCTARVVQRLLDRFGGRTLRIVCDKQGGRDFYREALASHWPGSRLTVLQEGGKLSGYEMQTAAGRRAELWFCQGADEKHLPAALASMYCKYAREVFMELLNDFWRGHVGDDLKATAGYFTDGQRFVRDVSDAARRLGIEPQHYIRQC